MAILSLRRTIQSLGYNVIGADGGPLEVKLPLFCNLHVSVDGHGEYTLAPYFGFIPRTTATWMMQALYLGLFLMVLWMSESDLKLIFTALAVMVGGMAWDVYRYVLTEGAMTRICSRLPPTDAA
jgi:hypothetical protein